MTQDFGPLDWRIAITDKQGRPSPEFQRRWNVQRANNSLITTVTIGTGAPSGTPDDGDLYFDDSVNPYVLYVGSGGTWFIASITEFTQLTDVPSSYTSKALELVRVNAGATGLEFVTTTAQLDELGSTRGSLLERGASGWTVLTPGTNGYILQSNGAGADPSWVTPPSSGVTSLTAGTGLSVNTSTGAVTVSLSTTAVTPGTYGDATHVGQFTVNAEGQITSASNISVSGGSSGALTLIQEVVTSGSQASVSFTGISTTSYRDLIIKARGRSASSGGSGLDPICVQINGDTGSNYEYSLFELNTGGSSGTQVSAGNTVLVIGNAANTSASSLGYGVCEATIFDCKDSTYSKIVSSNGFIQYGASDGAASAMGGGIWRNATPAAITSLKVFPANGNWINGSVISLYGST